MKVRYLGNAPGQGKAIKINKRLFERGKEYTITKELFKTLETKGGFEQVKKDDEDTEDLNNV